MGPGYAAYMHSVDPKQLNTPLQMNLNNQIKLIKFKSKCDGGAGDTATDNWLATKATFAF